MGNKKDSEKTEDAATANGCPEAEPPRDEASETALLFVFQQQLFFDRILPKDGWLERQPTGCRHATAAFSGGKKGKKSASAKKQHGGSGASALRASTRPLFSPGAFFSLFFILLSLNCFRRLNFSSIFCFSLFFSFFFFFDLPFFGGRAFLWSPHLEHAPVCDHFAFLDVVRTTAGRWCRE